MCSNDQKSSAPLLAAIPKAVCGRSCLLPTLMSAGRRQYEAQPLRIKWATPRYPQRQSLRLRPLPHLWRTPHFCQPAPARRRRAATVTLGCRRQRHRRQRRRPSGERRLEPEALSRPEPRLDGGVAVEVGQVRRVQTAAPLPPGPPAARRNALVVLVVHLPPPPPRRRRPKSI